MKSYRAFLTEGFAAPAIVAHRGDWQNAPENSLRAIQAAADKKIEIAEIDVRRSSDGVFFLMHDETLERTAGRSEQAQSLTWKELSKTRLRNRDGSGPLSDETIPSLEAALKAACGRIYLDIDVKYFEHMPEVAQLISSAGMADFVDIKVSVQTAEEAAGLQELEARYGVMVMPKTRFFAESVDDQIALLSVAGAVVVETKFDDLDVIATRQHSFRDAGIKVWVNTLDPVACCGLTDTRASKEPDAVWGHLMSAGVSIFQTDALDALLAFRNGLDKS